VATALFRVNDHCGALFSLPDKDYEHLMGWCPVPLLTFKWLGLYVKFSAWFMKNVLFEQKKIKSRNNESL
jgi:hypothetical protein